MVDRLRPSCRPGVLGGERGYAPIVIVPFIVG